MKRGFASDNNAGVHPAIMKAISEVNSGHAIAYGEDVVTEKAEKKFRDIFGAAATYFVFGGTGANVLSLKAITESYNSIICSDSAHLAVDECGAPEHFTGCKLELIPSPNGKITVEEIKKKLHGFEVHKTQPFVISITQATEYGTVYTYDEIKDITSFAHKNGLLVHMDGARIANACAFLGVSLKKITFEAGIDVLSFGGTKNGMMFGEAVVFFSKDLAENFELIRKQGMQLFSKMRFISAQFNALLTDELWLKNALHANKMAKLLESELLKIPSVKITQKVEANGVFAVLPAKIIPKLQKEYFFYVWNEHTSEVRLMCSFDTEKEDIDNFVKLLKSMGNVNIVLKEGQSKD